MGVVIDVNALPAVFDKKNSKHRQYRPVLRWIIGDKAKLIVGGTTYFDELKKLSSYLKYIGELAKINKVHREPDLIVDEQEENIKNLTDAQTSDDPHICALISVSQCRVLCSRDRRSFRLLRDTRIRRLFTYVPKIYTDMGHKPKKNILCDSNLTAKCNPHDKLSKEQIALLSFN
jgi:hypothetical protein